ncbi:hypothetical protein BJF79_35190 [Actinomadura sp. CNU-125]|nr:hypothetical protein BJF79_35190 [Actinomadura sp. CNU-125]
MAVAERVPEQDVVAVRVAVRSPRRRPAAAPRRTSASPKAKVKRPRLKGPTGPNFSTTTGLLLRNVMTGLCADVPGGGKGQHEGPVEQFTCNGSAEENQHWDLVVNQKGAGPGGADLFTIRNSKSGYCMDIWGTGAPALGEHGLLQNLCYPGAGDNQMWYLDRQASGRFWIRTHKGGMCLDVDGTTGAGALHAGLTAFPCSADDDHLWSFA